MHGTMLINSLLFGLGLAFEAFMVSLANGLNNANLRVLRAFCFAVMFAACHAIALWAGYSIVRFISNNVDEVESVLTWIAVGVLAVLGVKMICEGVLHNKSHSGKKITSAVEFLIQSVVAAFDAFAVGLTVSEYSKGEAALCGGIIATVITLFYLVGFVVGKKFGTKWGKYAELIGGLVFIGIAIEIAVGALV